jgi:hypothetical protein
MELIKLGKLGLSFSGQISSLGDTPDFALMWNNQPLMFNDKYLT